MGGWVVGCRPARCSVQPRGVGRARGGGAGAGAQRRGAASHLRKQAEEVEPEDGVLPRRLGERCRVVRVVDLELGHVALERGDVHALDREQRAVLEDIPGEHKLLPRGRRPDGGVGRGAGWLGLAGVGGRCFCWHAAEGGGGLVRRERDGERRDGDADGEGGAGRARRERSAPPQSHTHTCCCCCEGVGTLAGGSESKLNMATLSLPRSCWQVSSCSGFLANTTLNCCISALVAAYVMTARPKREREEATACLERATERERASGSARGRERARCCLFQAKSWRAAAAPSSSVGGRRWKSAPPALGRRT